MENATKALIIAASVLVTMLIITLGLVIYNKTAETADRINMSGYEIQAFNEKFDKYNGEKYTGSEVMAMIKMVFNHNRMQVAEGTDNLVSVYMGGWQILNGTENIMPTNKYMPSTANLYDIHVYHDSATGLVNKIIYVTTGIPIPVPTKKS